MKHKQKMGQLVQNNFTERILLAPLFCRFLRFFTLRLPPRLVLLGKQAEFPPFFSADRHFW
jgi:hypothetical protein